MTTTNILPGGRVNDSNTYVSADQQTILGDGSAANPLHTGPSSGGTFEAPVTSAGHLVDKGSAMMVSAGGTTIEPLDASTGRRCVGLLTEETVNGQPGRVQSTGPFTMTVAEWSAVIQGGAPSGLTPGGLYFASLAGAGNIGIFAFSPGDLALQIGTALDATTLILQVAPPVTTL